jgi:hypothetical protein
MDDGRKAIKNRHLGRCAVFDAGAKKLLPIVAAPLPVAGHGLSGFLLISS